MDMFAETLILLMPHAIYCFPNKENKGLFSFRFAANKQKFAITYIGLQNTNGRCCFPFVLFSISRIPETWRHGHGDIETWRWRHEDGDMET
jgi:hypothetical protein